MTVYYNENDPAAAAWLRELIADGQIAPGDVDERSIDDVRPSDVLGYTQCHWFAGIGGWSLALRLAGIPDFRPLWTGSCPCQPFSAAGARGGIDDPRHLWPALRWLIDQCRPPVVAGEQVASKAGRSWLVGVRADLEAMGYGVGAADLCAAGVGAPHIRQRLFWLADSDEHRAGRLAGDDGEAPRVQEAEREPELGAAVSERGCEDCSGRRGIGAGGGLADSDRQRRDRQHALLRAEDRQPAQSVSEAAGSGGECSGLGDSDNARSQRHGRPLGQHDAAGRNGPHGHGSEAGLDCWAGAVWLPCADGKARRIEPGIEPLVDGLPRGVVPSSREGMEINANETAEGRVMRLRGYGNAIVPQVAAEFLRAFNDA